VEVCVEKLLHVTHASGFRPPSPFLLLSSIVNEQSNACHEDMLPQLRQDQLQNLSKTGISWGGCIAAKGSGITDFMEPTSPFVDPIWLDGTKIIPALVQQRTTKFIILVRLPGSGKTILLETLK
jgi:hypothetical protein